MVDARLFISNLSINDVIALVDGNLSLQNSNDKDGIELCELLKEKGAITIDFSTSRRLPADHSLGKIAGAKTIAFKVKDLLST